MTFSPQLEERFAKMLQAYPEGKKRSAVVPMLIYAQDETGAVTPELIDEVAKRCEVTPLQVDEVVGYYSMLHRKPQGKFHVQVCGTTPCMLRGSDDLISVCKAKKMPTGGVSEDGLWTFTEVECMGNCSSAPMVQINDDNYEDLTAERFEGILDALARGESPKTGTQEPGRHTVEPVGALSSLTAMVGENHDYRGEW